jgi:uncharacterized protein (DUF305 family)
MYRTIATTFAAVIVLSAASDRVFADDAMSDYKQSMEKMNSEMQKGMDPDPTKAWAKMMIAHHEGAIDMSRIVLRETKDPTIQKMAEKTTGEQQKEIKQLQEWVSKHDK